MEVSADEACCAQRAQSVMYVATTAFASSFSVDISLPTYCRLSIRRESGGLYPPPHISAGTCRKALSARTGTHGIPILPTGLAVRNAPGIFVVRTFSSLFTGSLPFFQLIPFAVSFRSSSSRTSIVRRPVLPACRSDSGPQYRPNRKGRPVSEYSVPSKGSPAVARSSVPLPENNHSVPLMLMFIPSRYTF